MKTSDQQHLLLYFTLTFMDSSQTFIHIFIDSSENLKQESRDGQEQRSHNRLSTNYLGYFFLSFVLCHFLALWWNPEKPVFPFLPVYIIQLCCLRSAPKGGVLIQFCLWEKNKRFLSVQRFIYIIASALLPDCMVNIWTNLCVVWQFNP